MKNKYYVKCDFCGTLEYVDKSELFNKSRCYFCDNELDNHSWYETVDPYSIEVSGNLKNNSYTFANDDYDKYSSDTYFNNSTESMGSKDDGFEFKSDNIDLSSKKEFGCGCWLPVLFLGVILCGGYQFDKYVIENKRKENKKFIEEKRFVEEKTRQSTEKQHLSEDKKTNIQQLTEEQRSKNEKTTKIQQSVANKRLDNEKNRNDKKLQMIISNDERLKKLNNNKESSGNVIQKSNQHEANTVRITDVGFWEGREDAQLVIDVNKLPITSDIKFLNGVFFFDLRQCFFAPSRQRYVLKNQFIDILTIQYNNESNSTRVYLKKPKGVELEIYSVVGRGGKGDRVVILLKTAQNKTRQKK